MFWIRAARGGCSILCLVAFAGCGDDTVAPEEQVTALEAISPEGGAVNVDPTGSISMRFTGPMMSGMEQYVDLHRDNLQGSVHPMDCAWSDAMRRLDCTPSPALDHQRHYVLHLGGHMLDASGKPASMDPGSHMGGTVASPGMMGGSQGGTSMGGHMGDGWRHADGTYGMIFPFTTR